MNSSQTIEGDSYEEAVSFNTMFYSFSENVDSISLGEKPIQSSRDSDEISEPLEEILKTLSQPCCDHSYGGSIRLCHMNIDDFVERTVQIVFFEGDENEGKEELKQENPGKGEWEKDMSLSCIPEDKC